MHMKRILLSLIVLTSAFSLNVLAASSSELRDPAPKFSIHFVHYATTSDERDITMVMNPSPSVVKEPFRDLDQLKEFVTEQFYACNNNERKPLNILSIRALSSEESDKASVGTNPGDALARESMPDADITAQMALLNAALMSGHGAIRAKIQL